jgi:sarcosine oxidase subunit beta
VCCLDFIESDLSFTIDFMLPRTADIAVVGGGIFGLSIGASCARSGKRVVVLEREQIGAGSSGRSGAIIRACYFRKQMAQAVHHARRELWSNFESVFDVRGQREPAFTQTGMVILENEEILSKAKFGEWSVPIREISEDEVNAEFPFLRERRDGEIVLWDEEAGTVETSLALQGLRECIEENGGQVAEYSPAVGMKLETAGAWQVKTTAGDVSAATVVLAPGPWAAGLGRMADLELPIEPHKIQVTLLNRRAHLPGSMPVVSDRASDFYARPLEGGITHVGFVSHFDHTSLETADDFDESIRPDLARILRERFGNGLPPARASLVTGHRAAMYSVTADEYFILGRTPQPNLFVAAGGSGHGFKFGPLIGQETSALIDGDEAPFISDPVFAFEREFKSGRGVLGD